MRTLRPTTVGLIAVAAAATLTTVLLREPGGWIAFGLGDCEAHGGGHIAQPVLAWTAIALVLAGLWIAWTGDRTDPAGAAVLALAVAGAGLASFSAHATLADGAGVWDAAAVAVVLGVLTIRISGGTWATHLAVVAAVALVAVTAPALLEAIGLGTAIAAVGALGATHRASGRTLRWGLTAAAVGAVGLTMWVLGRTGAPLCDPDTVWQPHGAWHLLSAGALVLIHLHLRAGHGHTPDGGLRST